jgi:16S rRNA (guanine966-N2)-methyltransferase
VRETLFNWLGERVIGARCLDLYAGSGALGFEAASRGASRVVLVDYDPVLVRSLRAQAERLDADTVEIVQAPVEKWLEGSATPFDVVMMDPPFRSRDHAAIARLLHDRGWLAPGALIYVESALGYEALELPGSWRMLRSNKAGQVRYHLACADARGSDRSASEL